MLQETVDSPLAKALTHSLRNLARLLVRALSFQLAEWTTETYTVNRFCHFVGAGAIHIADCAFAVDVDHQPQKIRSHVVATEVVESLAQVTFVEINVNVDEPFEVFGGLLDQRLPVWTIDAGVAIVDLVVFGGLAWRRLQSDAGGGDCLERCQGLRRCLDSVCWSDDVRVCVTDVGVGVWIFQGSGVRVQRPCSHMNLLSERHSICFEERVHVLPAIKMANASNFSVHHHRSGVPGAVAEDKALNMGGADFATVVDDISGGINHHLRGVKTVQIHFGVAQRHEDRVLLGRRSDAVHLGRV